MTLLKWASAAALALSAPLAAQEPPDWRPVGAQAGQVSDLAGLEQLARDFPDSSIVRLRMLQPMLVAGEIDRLLGTLNWLKQRGYVFGAVSQEQIPKLVGAEHADAARALLLPEAEVIAASEVIALVPAEQLLVEGAGRTLSGKVIAGSIHSSTVSIRDGDGTWKHLSGLGGDAFGPMVRDANAESFWLSSGAPDLNTFDRDAFHGVMLVEIASGEVTVRLRAPRDGFPSDIALDSRGMVFASDPFNGAIYFGQAQDSDLKTLIPPGTFRSPQGLAVSEDAARLYVSDYRYGIAIIDLETLEVSRLASDIPVILDGVDGLWRHGNELIAVQNGTSPMRISAFMLSEDGNRVVAHRVLEQLHPEWTEPLSGSIDGDSLIYVGNGQWDRFVEGQLVEGKQPVATAIRRLPLN